METYPKLLAIGIMLPPYHSPERPAHKIYLIEDHICFIGYARGLTDKSTTQLPPVLKISTGIPGALRWCSAAFPPKENDNADELYKEIYHIIQNDRMMDYVDEYIEILEGKYQKDYDMLKISDPQNLVTDREKRAFKYY